MVKRLYSNARRKRSATKGKEKSKTLRACSFPPSHTTPASPPGTNRGFSTHDFSKLVLHDALQELSPALSLSLSLLVALKRYEF